MTTTILVTGGAGYIARACIVELLRRGYYVRATLRDAAKEVLVRQAVHGQLDPESRLTFAYADLNEDDGWEAAVKGCRYVIHVASPLGINFSADPQQLVNTAVGGTSRVMRAALKAGVERVVMTSAANAASPTHYSQEGVTDESLWTDTCDTSLSPYRRSKTLAEKTAWELIDGASDRYTTLTTILPGAVIGPVLSPGNLNSVQVISKLLNGDVLGIPKVGLEIVDVRDVADIHIRAMTTPAAANERFLATGELVWLADIANVLRENFKSYSRAIPSIILPNPVMHALALMKPELRELTCSLDRKNRHSTAKAEAILGWRPRPAHESIVDCAKSLIEWRLV